MTDTEAIETAARLLGFEPVTSSSSEWWQKPLSPPMPDEDFDYRTSALKCITNTDLRRMDRELADNQWGFNGTGSEYIYRDYAVETVEVSHPDHDLATIRAWVVMKGGEK